MIVSHRNHRFESGRLACDRFIFAEGVLRRTLIRDLVLDEQISTPVLGRGTEDRSRARIYVVLEGRLHATVYGQSTELLPGAVVAADAVEDMLTHSRGTCVTISLDWGDPGRGRSLRGQGKLGQPAFDAMKLAADVLEDAKPWGGTGEHARRLAATQTIHEVLSAEGLALDAFADAISEELNAGNEVDRTEQEYAFALDDVLTHLGEDPKTVDLEQRCNATRRTVTRQTHSFHQRYRLFGMKRQTDWRAVRDFYRLVTASVLVTHDDATAESVARAVGYGSASALCNAFANAGMPSPTKIRALSA